MFKALRILILLGILLTVAVTTLVGRWQAQSWKRPQVVTLYPINASGDAVTDLYLGDWTPQPSRDWRPTSSGRPPGTASPCPSRCGSCWAAVCVSRRPRYFATWAAVGDLMEPADALVGLAPDAAGPTPGCRT